MQMKYCYNEIECKTPMNHLHTNRLPYEWDLNIYRGCEHNCQYCFAMYTHQYMNDSDFFRHIYIKKNIVEQLEKKLSSKSWKKEIINLGGVTDNYQPIESKYQIMPEILKLCIRYKNPIIICTKSDLILRDIELIEELSKVAMVNVAFTITTLNEEIASKIEPGASLAHKRLEAMRRMKAETDAIVGIHMMPMIPYLTATRNNLKELFEKSYEIGIDYCIPGLLGLRGITRKNFLNFFYQNYSELYSKLNELYDNKGKKNEYRKQFYQLLNEIQRQYPVSLDYQKPVTDGLKKFHYELEQLQLF